MSEMVWTFPGGKPEQSVTSITLVNNTVKIQDVTVPAGKKWLLLGVKATNIDDVTRDVDIYIYKEAAKTNLLRWLVFVAALAANGASMLQWPSAADGSTHTLRYAPVILGADNTINVVWSTGGASTGATDADGLVVEYLEIDA